MRKLLFLLSFAAIFFVTTGWTVILSWNVDPADDMAGFRIYRSDGKFVNMGGGNKQMIYEMIKEVAPHQRTHTFHNVENGKYYYFLTSFDYEGNESDPSSEVRAILRGKKPK